MAQLVDDLMLGPFRTEAQHSRIAGLIVRHPAMPDDHRANRPADAEQPLQVIARGDPQAEQAQGHAGEDCGIAHGLI